MGVRGACYKVGPRPLNWDKKWKKGKISTDDMNTQCNVIWLYYIAMNSFGISNFRIYTTLSLVSNICFLKQNSF